MPPTIFDSRKLNAMSYFSCKLAAGDYVVSSTEAPSLSGALIVSSGGSRDFAAITFASDAEGELVFLNPPPFDANDAFYMTFNYFGDAQSLVAFSVQVIGPVKIDSSTLRPDQLFGYAFQEAGLFTYSAYLLMPPQGDDPPQFVLNQQGDIEVRDDASSNDPVLIELDGSSSRMMPITVQTGAFVSWEPVSGVWYVTGTATPPKR